MKKLYSTFSKYLYSFNADAGAGGAGAGGEGAGAVVDQGAAASGGAAPAGAAASTQQAADWFNALPEEVKKHERFAGIKTGEEFVKALTTETQTPEVYTLPEGTPEALGAWAKSEKLTQKQLDSILKKHQEVVSENFKGMVAANKAGAVKLFEAWGADKPANLQLANRVLAMSDPDGKVGVLQYMQSQESGYAMMNPVVIQMFHNIGKHLQESGFLKSEVAGDVSSTKKVNVAYEMYPENVPNKKK